MSELSRRDFIKVTSAVGAGALFTSNILAKTFSNLNSKKRYAIVGVGHRTEMWQKALYENYQDSSAIVGFCDNNIGRLNLYKSFAKEKIGKDIPIYLDYEFDKMIMETKPDTIIVTTVDGMHHKYIIRALELECDVITEKPMTIDEIKCQKIIDAQQKFNKKVIVSFNYRYSPARTQVKDLLMSGIIGDVLSLDFHWMLNTHHGADYFRRWHSQKDISGGLMVHKATHHFDLVNWWLSAVPVSVYAKGKREFYTPEMAKRFGLLNHHERCHTCTEKNNCGFELDLSSNKRLKKIYLDNEQHDGYFRDKCVFRPDISIEDTMNVIVKYNTNVTMSYSLNAFNSWEGYYIIFNGTKGRLEHRIEEKIYLAGDGREQGGIKSGGTLTKVFPLREPGYEVKVWEGKGGHGGGDDLMLDDIFNTNIAKDKYSRCADQRAGAYSILTGIAANHSMKSGKEILIDDLVKNIGMPDYTDMPNHYDSIPMPGKDNQD